MTDTMPSLDPRLVECSRCNEEMELGDEPDGCRDPFCPMVNFGWARDSFEANQ